MKTKEKMMLCAELAKARPDISSQEIVKDVGQFFRHAMALRKLVSDRLNAIPTPNYEERRDHITARANLLAQKYRATAESDGAMAQLVLFLESGARHGHFTAWSVLG